MAEKDILGDAQMRDDRQLLMDRPDATHDRLVRPGQSDCLALEEQLTVIGLLEPS